MFDVFIIGGGLAGLNVAMTLLNKVNFKVALAEPRSNSKNNPARLTFLETVRRFDIEDCTLGNYRKFGIISYHGASSVHSFGEDMFTALDYEKSRAKYFKSLRLNPNFIHIPERVTNLTQRKDYAEIRLKSGEIFRAKIVVDASGKSHFTLPPSEIEQPKLYSHNFGQSFIGCQNEKIDEAYFIAGSVKYGSGGGWFYPFGKNKSSVGFALISNTKSYPAKQLKENYYRAIKNIYPINCYLERAKAINFEVGTIPIQPISKFYSNRLLIVGDSGGQATSWMCMGVEPALNNSKAVAETIIEAFERNRLDADSLKNYQLNWDAQNKETFDNIENQTPKIWYFGEEVWDFIIEKDLNNISSQQFYDRIKYNAHLMPKWKALYRWILFRIKHFFDYSKYKQHI